MSSKKLTLGLLIFYLAVLTWIIVFKMRVSFEEFGGIRSMNLIPFGASVIVNGKIDYTEIIQNVLAFIPFGVLIYTLWEEKRLVWKILPMVLTSLAFEIVQYMLAIGVADITDVITNSSGGMLGLGIAFGISKIMKKNWRKYINLLSLICAVALTLFIAVLILANL